MKTIEYETKSMYERMGVEAAVYQFGEKVLSGLKTIHRAKASSVRHAAMAMRSRYFGRT